MKPLTNFISLNSRYSRSTNLERDITDKDSLHGYVLTPKNSDLSFRIIKGLLDNKSSAWTITGLYGTGKSSFINFFTGLCGEEKGLKYEIAHKLFRNSSGYNRNDLASFRDQLRRKGLVLAFVTSMREPICMTILRALKNGVNNFWTHDSHVKKELIKSIDHASKALIKGKSFDNKLILNIISDIELKSKSGLLIIIDELGKNLEYITQNKNDDLYILQQIAEFRSSNNKIFRGIIGVLHQAFSDYGNNLGALQKNEWSKIQGRFEDVPFIEAHDQTTQLFSSVITRKLNKSGEAKINSLSKGWVSELNKAELQFINLKQCCDLFPLHPLTAICLPILSERFGQNERSVFSFLTSDEPHSLKGYISESSFDEKYVEYLKPHHLFNYFLTNKTSQSSRHQLFQRWSEIQNIISDCEQLGEDTAKILKTIGLFNIISLLGKIRASKQLIILALLDDPKCKSERKLLEKKIDELIHKGIITHRKQIDELRLWKGSDVDVEKIIFNRLSTFDKDLTSYINKYFKLFPVMINRNSYETGNVRFFERRFLDNSSISETSFDINSNSSGLLLYWIDDKNPIKKIPSHDQKGKPILLLSSRNVFLLKSAALEYVSLLDIEENEIRLKDDKVASLEIKHRILIAKKLFENSFLKVFEASKISCVFDENKKSLGNKSSLNHYCSDLLDKIYHKSPKLWNELINRNALTAQTASAQKKLINAMLISTGMERFGIEGYGPERTICESLFVESGLYKFTKKEKKWSITKPHEGSGISSTWEAIEDFCMGAKNSPGKLTQLYEMLMNPPYGVKKEIIPILLLAFLIRNSENVCLYQDGSFVPIIGTHHFELLLKRPERFSIKYFEIKGLNLKLFKELESILVSKEAKNESKVRNMTILRIVKPLMKFIDRLSGFARNTTELSDLAIRVRKVLINAKEPDKLLFKDLPSACILNERTSVGVLEDFNGINLSGTHEGTQIENDYIESYKVNLVSALQEIQASFSELLRRCEIKICEAFSVKSDPKELREHLRVRSKYLLPICIEPRLRSFLIACIEPGSEYNQWLESVLVVISDKPVVSWIDSDELLFESKAYEIARRFSNLESLQKEFKTHHDDGFDAKRIVHTSSTGVELSKVLWVKKDCKSDFDKVIEKIYSEYKLENNKSLQEGVLSSFIEKALKIEPVIEKQVDEKESVENYG